MGLYKLFICLTLSWHRKFKHQILIYLLSNYFKDVEAVSKKARQDEDLGTEHLQVLERLKANQRRDYMKGTVSGSVQATDRLMKELRDIYRSPNFKSGAYQVYQQPACDSFHGSFWYRWSWSMILCMNGMLRLAGWTLTPPLPQTWPPWGKERGRTTFSSPSCSRTPSHSTLLLYEWYTLSWVGDMCWMVELSAWSWWLLR